MISAVQQLRMSWRILCTAHDISSDHRACLSSMYFAGICRQVYTEVGTETMEFTRINDTELADDIYIEDQRNYN